MLLVNLVSRDVGSSLGAMYWGLVLSIFTLGITVVQATIYWLKGKDKKVMQWTAGLLFILDMASTSLVLTGGFQSLVQATQPDYSPPRGVNPILAAECVFAIQIIFVAQCFFAFQIYCVKPIGNSGKVLMAALIVLCSLAWLFGTICFIMMFGGVHGSWPHWEIGLEIGFTGSKGSATLFDIVSTLAMCKYLKQGIKNGRRDSPITKLVRKLYLILFTRGLLVTCVQILLFVMDWTYHQDTIWPHLLVTRLYVTTFFAMLNSRDYMRDQIASSQFSDLVFKAKTADLSSGTVSTITNYEEHLEHHSNRTPMSPRLDLRLDDRTRQL